MTDLLNDFADAYRSGIEASGKEIHFLILISFMASFGFIRTSAHMIRAQVSWWPGNVETKGGTHVHHLVWGILALLVFGYIGLAFEPGSPWREIVAVLFGIGMGLTMDEFALWLNLEDVYWQEKGRESIDAVVVTAGLLTITLLGLQFWIDVLEACVLFVLGGDELSSGESAAILVPLQLIGVGLAIACFRKGKKLTGLVGLFVPLVALIGAVRPAPPR